MSTESGLFICVFAPHLKSVTPIFVQGGAAYAGEVKRVLFAASSESLLTKIRFELFLADEEFSDSKNGEALTFKR